MSTPRFVLSCLTSPCHPFSRLRTQDPLYSSPMSTAKILLRHQDAYVDAQDIYAGVYYVYNQDLISTVVRLLGNSIQ